MIRALTTLIFCILFSTPLFASTPMKGCLVASQACSAFQSIRKKTNPGNIQLDVGEQYHIKARNRKKNASHYQIRIDAKPDLRWVSTDCGIVTQRCGMTPSPPVEPPPVVAKDYLLALSWQPAFCQTHQTKKECRNQTDDRYDASHFSLHGLWPQPRNNTYCGVITKYRSIDRKKRWDLLPKLSLSRDTRSELERVMPGHQSNLQRHEWIKHGSCYSESAEEYFAESLQLTQQVNDSGLRRLFNNNLGNFLDLKDIKRQIDEDFGRGSGNKTAIRCDRKGNISEIWINLRGDVTLDSSVQSLLKSAPRAKSNCRRGGGFVDPAGF